MSSARPPLDLVGRDALRGSIREAVAAGGLTVLVGPAGVGKSRLAEDALADVVPVDLGPVRDADDLARVIGGALGVPEPDGDRIAAAWASRRDPAWLDAAEGLDDGAARSLAAWTRSGRPALVTSRRHLGVGRVVVVPPLAAVDAGVVLDARAADAGYTWAPGDEAPRGRLLELLDGLPLALELAAARLPALGAAGLVERLAEGLGALRVDGPDPRSLEAAFAASWALLHAADREVFAGTSLYAGPFAAADCPWLGPAGPAADRLGRLVERSLLRTAPGGRFQAWTTGRAFARAHAGPELVARVDEALAARAEALGEHLFGPAEGEARAQLEALLPTLLEAAERAGDTLPRLVLAFDPALQGRGPSASRRRWVSAASAVARGHDAARLLARRVQTEPAADLERALGDAVGQSQDPALGSTLRQAWGRSAWNRGDLREAESRYAEALSLAPSPRDRLTAAYALGGVRSARGDTAGALRTFEGGLAEAREHGSALAEGLLLGAMGVVAHDLDHPDAEPWLRRAVEALSAARDPRAATFRVRLADHAFERGDTETAAEEASAAVAELAAAGQLRLLGHAHAARALVTPDLTAARDDLVRGEALEARHGSRLVVGLIAAWRARFESAAGFPDAAADALGRARGALHGADHAWTALIALVEGHLALAAGDDGPARAALAAAEGPAQRSSEVRSARDHLARACGGGGVEVASDGAWFAVGGRRVDLSTRHPIRRVLAALVCAEGSSDVDTLFAAGWPGERATRDAARDRVYHAVGTLRRQGLGDALVRGEGGWRLLGAVRRS